MAHLAGGDPLSELQLGGATGAGVSLSSKGVARRERMQQDLALRRSTYFLQVQQQLFRRMHPSLPVPQTEEELVASGTTMTSYLEKQGGYKHQRDQALPMWIAAHAMDSAMMGDMHGCKEFLAILVTCMEQASHDGNWSVAYLLSLLEMPPSTIFSERIQHLHSLERPFSPLVPQPWAACALAYLKEVDVLANKKAELKAPKAPSKAAAAASEEGSPSPSPRRRPKFPKAPKGSPDPKGAWEKKMVMFHPQWVPATLALWKSRQVRCIVLRSAKTHLVFVKHPAFLPTILLHDSVSKQDTTQEPVSQNHHLLSYVKWMSTLVPSVLRTRTPFSAFLSKSIQLSYGAASGPIAPTFFPVPIPEGYCHVMPAGVSSSRRRAVHLSRTLHTVVMALNFWHSGGSFPDDASLQRAPNSLHRVLYRRIRSLLKSDGPALAFETTKAGRRFPELYARLGELSEVLTANGVSSNPYAKSFTGVEVQKDDSKMPELRPYRDLDPSRLKLSGTGHFDATPYLSDPLVLPYRDPRCLQSSLAPGVMPPLRDSQKTIGELASLWDSLGLLHLHREELDPNSYVRIFNAYKSELADRQIGDRRGANALESRISEFGPSSRLPAGYDIAELSLDPRRESLVIYITDRKDFYHQFWVSDCKAIGNSLGPKVHISHVEQCPSYATFANRYATRNKRYDRSKHGDRLGHQPSALSDKEHCFVAFKSILQGDHCGVDIATDAHTSVLQERGLLHPDSSLIATRPLVSQNLCQGLVIDDFFAISVERDGTLPQESEAYRKYRVSQEVYQRHKLAGSPQKDILGEASGKVIGAWTDSRPSTRARGLCTVSAPPSKRLGLSHVSLSVASLSHTSDALHLCLVGGWISAMGYRRPTYSLFDSAFRLVSSSDFDPNHPRLVSLPRPVANELVLASILHPLMMTDIGAKYHDRVFATDASSKKGAVCSAPITQQMSEILWKTSKSKGSYSRLMSPAEELLHRLGIREEIEQEENGPWETDRPGRPLAYRFDFIEVYAGAAKITKAMVNLGVPVGPPIEISLSMEYDLRMPHVILWLSYLVCNRLVLSIVVEPPCTTFSIIRRPALRSKFVPLGFQPREEKTQTGNILSSRASQLVYIAGENKVAGLLETPYSSFLKHTPAFRAAANKPYARQVRVDSCRFGSPHLKSLGCCAYISSHATSTSSVYVRAVIYKCKVSTLKLQPRTLMILLGP